MKNKASYFNYTTFFLYNIGRFRCLRSITTFLNSFNWESIYYSFFLTKKYTKSSLNSIKILLIIWVLYTKNKNRTHYLCCASHIHKILLQNHIWWWMNCIEIDQLFGTFTYILYNITMSWIYCDECCDERQ